MYWRGGITVGVPVCDPTGMAFLMPQGRNRRVLTPTPSLGYPLRRIGALKAAESAVVVSGSGYCYGVILGI